MVLSSASMEQQWGFLIPWCKGLQGKLFYGRIAVKGGLWDVQRNSLHVSLRRNFAGANITAEEEEYFQLDLRKARESLALLAAVEHADKNAWRYLLTVHCGIDMGKEGGEKFDDEIPVKFLLCLDLEGMKNDNSDVYDLVKFCGVDQRENPSEEYLETLKKIAALDERVQLHWRGVDILIPVHVFFSTDRVKAMDVSVRELEDVGKAEIMVLEQWRMHEERTKMQTIAHGSLRCTFVLEPVVADFLGMRLNSRMVETMETLVRNNVWFSEIKRMRLEFDAKLWDDEFESKKMLGRLLGGLFGNTLRSRELVIPKKQSVLEYNTQPDPLQLDQVQLLCPSTMPAADFVAVASAMVLNQTVRKLDMRLIPQAYAKVTTRHWWKWLAYAVFSNRACASSSLESLAITKLYSMTIADIDEFAAVLASKHPEEQLVGATHGEVDERVATLRSGAEIRWQFNCWGDALPDKPLKFPTPTPFVQTFSDDGASEWVNVLIPGYGHCEVQRENLEFHESSLIEATRSPRRLSAISIEFISDRTSLMDGLPLFLATIGPSLKVLTLQGRHLDIDINVILRCCPNLLELSLGGDVVDVQFNFNCYREFGLPLPELHSDWNAVDTLSEALIDGTNPLAKCIHRLRVRPANRWLRIAHGPFDTTAFEADLKFLLDMLEENLSLKYLEVTVPAQYVGYMENFRKFNRQPTQHIVKLSLKAKAAFISAVSRQNTLVRRVGGGPQRRLPSYELSEEVICNIFAFARSPVLRQVFFRSEHIYLG